MMNTRVHDAALFDSLSAWVSVSVHIYCTCVYESMSVKYCFVLFCFFWMMLTYSNRVLIHYLCNIVCWGVVSLPVYKGWVIIYSVVILSCIKLQIYLSTKIFTVVFVLHIEKLVSCNAKQFIASTISLVCI